MKLKRMLLQIVVFIILVILIGFFIYRKATVVDYTPTQYESEMIKYFEEVALQLEFQDNSNRLMKWKKPMKIFIESDSIKSNQTKSIEKAITVINKLSSDGFRIEISDDFKESNVILYLCTKDKVNDLNPEFYKIFMEIIDVDILGFGHILFDRNSYEIKHAYIFVDTTTKIDVQEATILEELTHSIGLPNDSKKYPKSVFYEDKTEEGIQTTEYTKMDKDLIRILYHPKMKPGMNFKQSERVIKQILKSEKEQSRFLPTLN